MLIKRTVLERIEAGEIDLIFRRWRRPTVKAGGTLRTSIGMLAIDAVESTAMARITVDDARRAGYDSRAALERDLRSRDGGAVFRIAVHLAGDDPRVTLRNRSELDTDELDDLLGRLARLDRASRHGPWTEAVLRLLGASPHVRAQDLADRVGLEKAVFKSDVSKLKALGLTISHSPGYEVSPRGQALLDHLDGAERRNPVNRPEGRGAS